MGGSQSQHFQLLPGQNDYQLYCDPTNRQIFQMHTITCSNKQLPFALKLSNRRLSLKSQNLIQVVKVQADSESLCGDSSVLRVMTERVDRLQNIKSIKPQQSLQFFQGVVKGFAQAKTMLSLVCSFANSKMICRDKKGKAKVWINQNFSSLEENRVYTGDQRTLLQSIADNIFLKTVPSIQLIRIVERNASIKGSNLLQCLKAISNLKQNSQNSLELMLKKQEEQYHQSLSTLKDKSNLNNLDAAIDSKNQNKIFQEIPFSKSYSPATYFFNNEEHSSYFPVQNKPLPLLRLNVITSLPPIQTNTQTSPPYHHPITIHQSNNLNSILQQQHILTARTFSQVNSLLKGLQNNSIENAERLTFGSKFQLTNQKSKLSSKRLNEQSQQVNELSKIINQESEQEGESRPGLMDQWQSFQDSRSIYPIVNTTI